MLETFVTGFLTGLGLAVAILLACKVVRAVRDTIRRTKTPASIERQGRGEGARECNSLQESPRPRRRTMWGDSE